MSRADPVPAEPPRLGGSLRRAASDFYFNSWRLVPANALWGIGLVILLLILVRAPGPITALLFVLLAIPTAGIYRLAALIARGESVAFSDVLRAMRRYLRPALGAGAAIAAGTLMFATNIVLGISNPGILGWVVMTLAAWGLAALWVGALAFWPLLVDPTREGHGARAAARLASLLVLAHPVRMGALGLISAAIAVVSTVAFAAIITMSVAFIALIGCRYVLPAADRLEAALEARNGRKTHSHFLP